MDWHPHLHILITWGVFLKDGSFVEARETPSKDTLEKLFRHKVLKMMLNKNLITKDVVDNLLSWHSTGFDSYISDRILPAAQPGADPSGKPALQEVVPQKLLSYLVRAPVALEQMTVCEDGLVIYKAEHFHL